MINTPNNNKIDLRKNITLGLQKDIDLSVKLEKNYKPFSDALWQKKQDEMYLNMLHVKNNVSLGQLLANELENENQTDISIVKQITMSLLLTITDEKIANYVIENLSINHLNYVNQNWPFILSSLKKSNQKMNKEAFISFLKVHSLKTENEINTITNRYTNYDPPALPEPVKTYEDYDKEEFITYVNFYNEKTGAIVNRINKMTNQEMEDITDDYDGKAMIYQLLSRKNKAQLITYLYKRTDRTFSSSLQKAKIFKIAQYVGYVSISPQEPYDEEGEENNKLQEGGKIFVKKAKKKNIFFGRGLTDDKRFEIGKFYIDLGKLKNNILNVKYTSCRGSVPNIKVERISDDLKDVILDIIGNKYNSKLFDKLFTDDQRIIANLIKTLRIPDINMDVFNKKYQHEYEILLGQVNSGNTNEKVKLQLKKYILRGISENLIPRNQGLNQLLNLS